MQYLRILFRGVSSWRGRRDLNSRGEYHRISNPARYQAMRRPQQRVRDTARICVLTFINCSIQGDTMLAKYLQHQDVSSCEMSTALNLPFPSTSAFVVPIDRMHVMVSLHPGFNRCVSLYAPDEGALTATWHGFSSGQTQCTLSGWPCPRSTASSPRRRSGCSKRSAPSSGSNRSACPSSLWPCTAYRA